MYTHGVDWSFNALGKSKQILVTDQIMRFTMPLEDSFLRSISLH